jgi:hypothetical protein
MNLPLLLFLPGSPNRHRKDARDSKDNGQQCRQRQMPQGTAPLRSLTVCSASQKGYCAGVNF